MDPRRKLLFVITEFFRGGAEVALINLFKELTPKEVCVDFIILSQKTIEGSLVNEVPEWINVCNAGEINLQNGYTGSEEDFLLGGRAAKEFISEKIYDIAFSYGEWCRLEFVAEMVNAREKDVWIHTDIVNCLYFDEKKFFSSFLSYRYYIFVSETTRINAVKKYPFIEQKSYIIHNVLDCEKLLADSNAYSPHLDEKTLNRLITVANVRHEKGYLRILEVATELKNRKFSFCWNCIGKFSDENLAEWIQKEITRRGLNGKLVLKGAIENPHPYTKNSELFVLLSDYEAWPLAMAEAMILGVPAVATATSGAKEHIQDGNNGILTSFDIENIADNIERFFTELELRKRIEQDVKQFKDSLMGVNEFKQFIVMRGVKNTIMERLNFGSETPYNAIEGAAHLNRYSMVKGICAGKKVLDAACGEGYGSFLIKKWGADSVDGVDIDENAIMNAQRVFGSADVRFHCNSVEKLPFPDYTFDLIISLETIEHLEHPELFLKEIKRVLKPDGIIILSCPNDPYYHQSNTNYSNPFHKRQYNFFEFKSLTETYLGNHVRFFLETAVNGFLNMPLTFETTPNEGSEEIASTMLDMLNYENCENSLFIKQDRYINRWNSTGFLGIWGAATDISGVHSTIFPREFFMEFNDTDVKLVKELECWKEKKKEYEDNQRKLIEEKEGEINAIRQYFEYEQDKEKSDLVEKYRTLQMEHERTVMMLELCNKEKENLYNTAYSNYGALEQARAHCRELNKSNEELSSLLVTAQTELNIMKSTKGYKLLNFIYRVRCKLGLVK